MTEGEQNLDALFLTTYINAACLLRMSLLLFVREGATIRNQHTLCNNLFPILQPPVSVILGELKSSTSASTPISSIVANLRSHRANSSESPPSSMDTSSSSSSPSKATTALFNPSSPLWDAPDIEQSLDQYSHAVDQYWSHISFSSTFNHPRLELLLEDMRSLLSRFATQASFSSVSRGGGKVRQNMTQVHKV